CQSRLAATRRASCKKLQKIIRGSSSILKTVHKGNLKETSQLVQGLAAMIVSLSRNSISSLTGSESVTTAGSGYDEISLNGITKLKSLSQKEKDAYERSRDERAQVLAMLSETFATMTCANYEQIRLVSNTIQVVSTDADDLSRTTQINCKNKLVEVADAVVGLSGSLSKERLTELSMPVLATLSQIITASNVHVSHGTLTDKRSSMATPFGDYDTDWESSRDGFANKPLSQASSAFVDETNGVVQTQVSTEVTSSCMSSITKLTKSMTSKLVMNDKPMNIKSSQLSLVLQKSEPASLSGSLVRTGRSRVTLPTNMCSVTGGPEGRCTGARSSVSLTAMATPTNPYVSAATNNGDCSVSTTSEVVTLNLSDENGTEISVTDTGSSFFDIFLRKDPTFEEPNYIDPNPMQPIPRIPEGIEIPGTADGPFGKNRIAEQKLILHEFQLTGSDQSVHFQLRFENFTLGVTPCRQFLVVGRLWKPPSLTDASEGFDWWGMIPSHTRFCNETPGPNDPDPFTFFVTNAEYKEAKARVKKSASDWDRSIDKLKFGVREMSQAEWNRYGPLTRPSIPYEYTNQFSIKYTVRIFSASCYAIKPGQPSWNTGGCTVGPLTTVRVTHCQCTHLTSFAGGWVESPNTIDWNYVFSNFDFTKNPTLFVTEIVIAVIFIAVFVWARRSDKKDLEKLGVAPLPDNNPDHKYLYEIVVSTGMRRGAGTDSKVFFILSGERDETDTRHLMDRSRKVLQRGCVDRFLLAVERPLGSLNFLRLWHDNSGEGSAASWYCNYVSIIDLQTRRRYHFVVNRWMAVEEDDGAVDRVVPVAGNQELGDFSYLFSMDTKKRLTDGHLWLSVMARPPESRFTRVERVACCLMLLFLSMVTTCMFYQREGPSKPAASDGLTIGPFLLTPRMIYVGVVTNLISFLPLFVVMELFRRSKLRVGYINQLKKAINDHFDGADWGKESQQGDRAKYAESPAAAVNPPASVRQVDVEEKKLPKQVRFPWWVRIIAWSILVIGTAVSALFTTFYGIQFGDETCKKWISSLFISFFSSVMLSQPLKVLMMAAFMALLCKKNSVDEEEFLDDEEEVLNELGQRNGLQMDEEWLHEDDLEGQRGQCRSGIQPPSGELLERARERRLKEKKMFDILREISFYMLFYFLLLFVTFAFRDPNAYVLKEQMERLLLPDLGMTSGEGIPGISTEEEFWNWMQTKFMPGIRAGPWYNNDPPLLQRGFTGDRVARLVGYAIMRQKRVRMDTCSVLPSVRYLVGHCVESYSFSAEEKSDFSPKWQAYDPNKTSSKPQYEAFKFTSGSALKNMGPYMARQYTYASGGYVFQFRGSLSAMQANINELKTLQWLDRQTRAVFIDLAFYNPNVNLFGIGTIVFELSGTGGMVGIYRFQAANLLSFLGSGLKSFEIACQVLFCLMLLGMIIKELRNIYKQRKAYFWSIWNLAELFILFGSVLSIAAYAYVIYETSKLTEEFSKYGGNVYLNFQYVAFWNEYLTYFTAFIVFVSTLKFIRLLRFNKRMGMMGDVVRIAAKDIRQFFIMFFIMFCAFVQTFHLIFLQRLYGYSTFLYTMEQLMQIALGKFKFLELYESEPILGPLIFAMYAIFVIFILLNMFVSILNEAFAKVKDDVEKQENEHEMVDFMVQKAMMFVGLGQSRAARAYFGHNLASTDYRNQSLDEQLNVTLPSRVDKLLAFINKTYLRGGPKAKPYKVEAPELEEPQQKVKVAAE
uniref:PLAT domain-containing protein n=2 Tax=Macrostomum lignano TaxID=282301 RepID=A0A1I8GMZ4_9PLAT